MFLLSFFKQVKAKLYFVRVREGQRTVRVTRISSSE